MHDKVYLHELHMAIQTFLHHKVIQLFHFHIVRPQNSISVSSMVYFNQHTIVSYPLTLKLYERYIVQPLEL